VIRFVARNFGLLACYGVVWIAFWVYVKSALFAILF